MVSTIWLVLRGKLEGMHGQSNNRHRSELRSDSPAGTRVLGLQNSTQRGGVGALQRTRKWAAEWGGGNWKARASPTQRNRLFRRPRRARDAQSRRWSLRKHTRN